MKTRTAEDTLRRLVADSLVPDNLLEKALMRILEAWASKDADALQLVWQVLEDHEDLLLSGPTPNILTRTTSERFVAALYARRGYATTPTRATRDGGFDVVGIRDKERGEGRLIQAKKTKGVVGISVIRELIGARFLAPSSYKNHVLVVATTGSFSKPARDAETMFASEFELRDFHSLQEELEYYRLLGVRDIVQEAMELRGKTPATGR